jgi:hypothetical protein
VVINTAPIITNHPDITERTVVQGGTFPTLSVSATSSLPISYQWYSNTTNSNVGGTLISGATSATYTPLATTIGTLYYYVVVSNPCVNVSNVSGWHTVEPIIIDANGCNNMVPGWGESLGVVSFQTNNIWVVGNQAWSDAVTATNCSNKTTFNGGDFIGVNNNADCRSNPGFPGDVFSWCAVNRFPNTICPAPWRVPTRQDFIDLDIALGGNGMNISDSPHYGNYFTMWGAVLGGGGGPGPMLGTNVPWGSGNYWSSDQHSSRWAYFLQIGVQHYTTFPQNERGNKWMAYTLRCVRDTIPPVDSTLILDVTLENLTTGLVDRSIYKKTMHGGTAGVSVYSEGGLRLNRTGGAVPKWEFNRVIANVSFEFEVKLLAKPSGHGRTVAFVLNPERDFLQSVNLRATGRDEIMTLFDDTRIQNNFPVNVWTKIRVEVGNPVNETVDVKLYQDGVLKISHQSNYFNNWNNISVYNMVFGHISLGGDFGHAYHDRADAVIRNLKVWITKP